MFLNIYSINLLPKENYYLIFSMTYHIHLLLHLCFVSFFIHFQACETPNKQQTSVSSTPLDFVEITPNTSDTLQKKPTKMNGVSFVSPSAPFPEHFLAPIQTKVSANWMAVSPFGFSYANQPEVRFGTQQHWWGERPEGAAKIIEYAHNHDLKVMLKPQVWMRKGWVGGFEMTNEQDWQTWQQTYEDYILTFAKIADTMDVALFCIGTEYRIAAVERADFWRQLIQKVRKIYDGPITYAANWDNYENIPFWQELDYIGIDCYMPLVEPLNPSINALKKAWKPKATKIKSFAQQQKRPIIFTEYGYMSVAETAWQNWENEKDRSRLTISMTAQENAFEALYQTFWDQEWFAGGFIWKWYHDQEHAGGINNKDYTPQNKPVETTIKKWYSKYQ
ncbi:MAG: glycoside hydrolase family 113 [Chitinophagales bacterium]